MFNESPDDLIAILLDNEDHDIVVSESSQRGGLTGNSTSSPAIPEQQHIGSPNNAVVQGRVKQLLNESPNSSYFSNNGFSPEDITSNYRINHNNSTPNSFQDGDVVINYPNQDQLFNAGESINIDVSSYNGVDKIIFAGLNKHEIAPTISESTSQNTTFDYAIPSEAYDDIIFIVAGYDDDEMVDYDLVTIKVTPNSTINGIMFNGDKLYIPDN